MPAVECRPACDFDVHSPCAIFTQPKPARHETHVVDEPLGYGNPWIVKRAMTESETDTATETSTRTIEPLPPHYHWNFGAALVHGVFFLASNAFSSPTVVLPAFVALLTPSQIMVGLPMSIVLAGQILPQLFRGSFRRTTRPQKTTPGCSRRHPSTLVGIACDADLLLRYEPACPRISCAHCGADALFGSRWHGLVVYADIIAKVFPANRRADSMERATCWAMCWHFWRASRFERFLATKSGFLSRSVMPFCSSWHSSPWLSPSLELHRFASPWNHTSPKAGRFYSICAEQSSCSAKTRTSAA